MMSNNEGWVCPLCGKANAPWVPQCGCDKKANETVYPFTPWYPGTADPKWYPPYPTYPIITCCARV
jgi:hypothetical protein